MNENPSQSDTATQSQSSADTSLADHISQNVESILAIHRRESETLTPSQRRLERVSRFVGRPFYKMEASGSRKRLGDGKVPLMSGIFFSSRIRCGLADSESPATHRGDRTNTSGTVSGSRLLPPHRTATRQSGSPPCRGKAAAPGRGNAAPPILQTGFARNDFSLRRPCHP